MKKLLSLLSVLIINGTAVPTIIAASSYQKEEILNRVKIQNRQQIGRRGVEKNTLSRSNSVIKILKKIKKTSNFSSNSKKCCADKSGTYINFLRESTNNFEITNNVQKLEMSISNNYPNKKVFRLLNNNNHNHKIIPLSNGNDEIELVFRTSDLYLEGIVNINNNDNNKTYWHFSDSTIKDVDGAISKSLNFTGNYSTLACQNKEIKINRESINSSIKNLSLITENNRHTVNDDLVRTIFITSESMRFFSVKNSVKKILSNDKNEIIWSNHKETLNNWGTNSEKYHRIIETGTVPENKEERDKIFDIAILAKNQQESRQ